MFKFFLPSLPSLPSLPASLQKRAEPPPSAKICPTSVSALAPLLDALPSTDFLSTFVSKCGAGAVVTRFLRTSPDVLSAELALRGYLDWRTAEGLDGAPPTREKTMAFLGGPGVRMPVWMGPGGRLAYLDVGLFEKNGLDCGKLVRGMGVLFEWLLYEEGCAVETERAGGQVVAVGDFAGFSVRQAQVRILVATVNAYMSNYAGCLKTVVIVNYPTAIQILWKIVCPLLDDATRASIIFLPDPHSLGAKLSEILPEDTIPDFLGGTYPTKETASNDLTYATSTTVPTSSIRSRFGIDSPSNSSPTLSQVSSAELWRATNGR